MSPEANQALEQVPLFEPEMFEDPYPIYHQLRAADPVHWSDKFNAWIVTRFDEVAAGLNDLRLASDRSALFQEMAGNPELAPFFSFLSRRMVFADPPQHTRLRGLLNKAFTPHVVEALRPHMQQLVDGFLDAVQGQGDGSGADFAFPLPATVITELLGVPAYGPGPLRPGPTTSLSSSALTPPTSNAKNIRAPWPVMHGFSTTSVRLWCGCIRKNARCLLTDPGANEEQGDRLTEEELIRQRQLAAHRRTRDDDRPDRQRHAGPAAQPDQIQALRESRLDCGPVEEFLATTAPCSSPIGSPRKMSHWAARRSRRRPVRFPFLAAANRDPAHFPDPDRLDPGRANNKHVPSAGAVLLPRGTRSRARSPGRLPPLSDGFRTFGSADRLRSATISTSAA